jgi:hypothetical protein
MFTNWPMCWPFVHHQSVLLNRCHTSCSDGMQPLLPGLLGSATASAVQHVLPQLLVCLASSAAAHADEQALQQLPVCLAGAAAAHAVQHLLQQLLVCLVGAAAAHALQLAPQQLPAVLGLCCMCPRSAPHAAAAADGMLEWPSSCPHSSAHAVAFYWIAWLAHQPLMQFMPCCSGCW